MVRTLNEIDVTIITDLGVRALRMIGDVRDVDKICGSSVYWLSISRLYIILAKKNEIIPLQDIEKNRKIKYWKEILEVASDRQKWVKISMCHALYLFDTLNEG